MVPRNAKLLAVEDQEAAAVASGLVTGLGHLAME